MCRRAGFDDAAGVHHVNCVRHLASEVHGVRHHDHRLAGSRQVAVRASARDGSVELAVLDTGTGIARSDLERIFEPFFTRKANGMGMGLAICRNIVEAHGGRIFARNRTERGSAFELRLPARTASS